MANFRILCLTNGLLDEWEEIEAENVVEALRVRRVGQFCERVEVWSAENRVAVLRPVRSELIAPKKSNRSARRA